MLILLRILLTALVVLAVSKLLPGFRVRSFGSAVGVAIVYGVLSWLLKGLLVFLSFPLILITFGLFLIVVNAILLWLTDKLVAGFKVDNFGTMILGSVLMSIGSVLVEWVLPNAR